MYDDDVHSHELEQHHVAREALFEILVDHCVAAEFDDDGLAVEAFDVRQRLGKNGRLSIDEALDRVGAGDLLDNRMQKLSGGEMQRVLLARALAVEAGILLMDEPLANLDPPHQADWLALVRALTGAGKTVVSVLHEITMALQADEMLLLSAGRIAHQGGCSHPQTHRALERLFEGRIAIAPLAGQFVALPKV